MRIKDTGLFLSPYSQVREKGSAAQTEAAAKSGKNSFRDSLNRTVRTDRIELSSRQEEPAGRMIGSLRDSICEELGTDTDAARLQHLESAVKDGSYSVDCGALAETLLFDK
jgi:anti-sigma28 factor (negative regulator of flagellin synthesis)